VALATVTLAGAGCIGDLSVATIHVPDQQLALSVRREHAHWFLAEYKRTAILETPERHLSCVLPVDTGGTVRINVYRATPTRYILRDRFSALEIVRDRGGDCGDLPAADVSGVFVGAFDAVDGRWQFLTPSERGELAFDPPE
jgi:hypothetical protein